jgi:hypothetical protein
MRIKHLLIKLDKYFSSEKKWTQFVIARDAHGQTLSCVDYAGKAACMCLTGAVYSEKLFCNWQSNDLFAFLRELLGMSLSTYNDTHTFAEMKAMLKRAIEAAP